MSYFICGHKHESRMWKTDEKSHEGLKINTKIVQTWIEISRNLFHPKIKRLKKIFCIKQKYAGLFVCYWLLIFVHKDIIVGLILPKSCYRNANICSAYILFNKNNMSFFVINMFALWYYFSSFSTKIHIISMQKYIF